jgi:hypothetical protein
MKHALTVTLWEMNNFIVEAIIHVADKIDIKHKHKEK